MDNVGNFLKNDEVDYANNASDMFRRELVMFLSEALNELCKKPDPERLTIREKSSFKLSI